MRWWWIVVSALAATASIAAVVVAISSVTEHGDLERIKTALQLQTNCPDITVGRPSRARVIKRWEGTTVQTADIRCTATGGGLIYAKFANHATLGRELATSPPSGRYCVLGNAIVLDRLVRVTSTVMSDTCQSLGGTLIAPVGPIAQQGLD